MLTKPMEPHKKTKFTEVGVKLHLEVDCIHVYAWSIIRSHVYTGDYNSIN